MGRHRLYMHWFHHSGMPSVYMRDGHEVLHLQVPSRTRNVESLTYVPHGQRQTRVVYRMLWVTVRGIKLVMAPGQMAYGKLLLEMARDTMEDLDHIHIYRGMLARAGLSIDPDVIDVSGDFPDKHAQHDVEVPVDWDNFMTGDITSISQILVDNLKLDSDACRPPSANPGPSTAALGRRDAQGHLIIVL